MSQAPDPFAPFQTGHASVDPAVEEARREIAAHLPPNIRVDLESCFPQRPGWSEKRANQNRLELIQKNATVLERALGPRDRVRYIVLAREQLWWEVFVAGQWAMLVNRTVIVVTDEKLIAIHTDGKGRPALYLNQIPFAAIKKIGGWLANMSVVTAKGKRVFNMKSADRKAVSALVASLGQGASGGVDHVCPSCFSISATHIEQCASCPARFKSPRIAGLRSLILPGLGSWYAGNKGFAAFQIFRAIVLWALFIGIAGSAAATKKESGLLGVAVFFMVFLVIIHSMDAAISRAQAKKGLIALDEKLPSVNAR